VRSVGYVVLIHARVALPTPDYPFLDSFGSGILGSLFAGCCIAPPLSGRRNAYSPARVSNPKPYILWCYIKMQENE
jgi:hypothetical protein